MSGPKSQAIRWALIVGAAAMALSAIGCAPRVYANPGAVSVYSAPPPRRQVVVQRPSQPYANAQWVEGHYQWNGNQYVWVDGYWVQQRAGYTFSQPRWVQQGNRHVYVRGGWSQGGRVVHYVQPRQNVVVRGPSRRGVVVQRRAPVRRGVVVQSRGRRGGVVVQSRGRPVQRRGYNNRRGNVQVRGRRGGARVYVRPR